MFKCFSNWKGGAILLASVAVGGYLVIWHRQHLAVFLPFTVLLACPLMHLFMHGGHGHGHRHGTPQERDRGKLP